MKRIFLKNLFLIPLILYCLLLPTISLALELQYPEFGGYRIETNMDINQLIAWFYYFIVATAGFAAFVMLVWGGFTWLTSIGNPTRISDAKDRIFKAILGLLLILASYLILQIINPDLTTLTLPTLP